MLYRFFIKTAKADPRFFSLGILVAFLTLIFLIITLVSALLPLITSSQKGPQDLIRPLEVYVHEVKDLGDGTFQGRVTPFVGTVILPQEYKNGTTLTIYEIQTPYYFVEQGVYEVNGRTYTFSEEIMSGSSVPYYIATIAITLSLIALSLILKALIAVNIALFENADGRRERNRKFFLRPKVVHDKLSSCLSVIVMVIFVAITTLKLRPDYVPFGSDGFMFLIVMMPLVSLFSGILIFSLIDTMPSRDASPLAASLLFFCNWRTVGNIRVEDHVSDPTARTMLIRWLQGKNWKEDIGEIIFDRFAGTCHDLLRVTQKI